MICFAVSIMLIVYIDMGVCTDILTIHRQSALDYSSGTCHHAHAYFFTNLQLDPMLEQNTEFYQSP